MVQSRSLFFLSTLCMLLVLASCSFNPFRTDNEMTGTATGTAIGGVVGATSAAVLDSSKTVTVLAGLAGATIGYYVTTLSFASGGITHVGGKVYTIGDFITIEIPSDILFDVNTADFLPQAGPVLDSTVDVLNRKPNNNILVSGNTSGFYANKYELKLSEDRARQVTSYLWAHGINNFKNESSDMRKLTYVGYGSYFPIANNIKMEGVRQNSRIQITSYPSKADLHLDKKHKVFHNIGGTNETSLKTPPPEPYPSFSNVSNLPETDSAATDSDIAAETWETYK